jgi:adenine specific DNA methylase Mod
MTQSNSNYEKRFLDSLKAIFIGAKVEGESGYINLMKIKGTYFEKGVFPQLMKDIDAACKPFEIGFREELFDKLHDFFQHYFSESGSIYFRNTAQHHNIYEKVYTDDRDVMLFWKTNMLYYVKTDRLYNSLDVEIEGEKFFFDASEMELKRSNEKRALNYAFKSYKEGKLILSVAYTEGNKKNKTDEIIQAAREKGLALEEETLEKAFRVFEKQSEVDYFINKNAQAFLREQFDLWMYQYIFKGESIFNEVRLKQLQTIKEIAYKIIDFIAQFEDELVRIWNKPKFVLNSHYVITLDKIAGKDENLVKQIFNHAGMKAQIAEWQDLGIVDEVFEPSLVFEKDLTGEPLNRQYKYLPLDTKYFIDLELDILSLFDDLDASLDGWLIHSENYQALNTLNKFAERISTIFIDPPYNTGNNDFLYKDKYCHSSWMTMIENRLQLALQLLDRRGALFITINDIEVHRLRLLADGIFGENNFIANIVWQKKQSPQNDAINFSDMHDHILAYSRQTKSNRDDTQGWQRNLLNRTDEQNQRYSNPDRDPRGDWASGDLTSNKTSEERPNLYYPVVNPNTKEEVWPAKSRAWRFEKDLMKKSILENRIWWGETGNNFPRLKRFRNEVAEGVVPSTWWTREEVGDNQGARRELRRLFFEEPNENATPKPSKLIENILRISGGNDSINLDFFSGSGTTAHAVMNLNRSDNGSRKYILVEMGDHFSKIILPRIKKVAFSDKWKEGKAQEGVGVSHFAKYFKMEQYEDTLRKAQYEDAPLFSGSQDAYTSYVFLRDLKMLEAVRVDSKNNTVDVNLEKLYEGIDLAETLSCLKGKWIKRITKDTVIFEDDSTASLSTPVWDDVKPLIWW